MEQKGGKWFVHTSEPRFAAATQGDRFFFFRKMPFLRLVSMVRLSRRKPEKRQEGIVQINPKQGNETAIVK